MYLSLLIPGDIGETLEAFSAWASSTGFDALDTEVDWSDADVKAVRRQGLELGPLRIRASLADSDLATRKGAITIACDAIDRASRLGIDQAWMLTRNFRNDSNQRTNFVAAIESLREVVRHAERMGIHLSIENCPFNGQNPICTPEAWDALFSEIKSDVLGICFDPSHCIWQGIDYARVVREYGDRILHVHAKDTEIIAEGQFRYGVAGPQLVNSVLPDGTHADGWWRHRLPGMGLVNWNVVVTSLVDCGYDKAITLEHEDPVWMGSANRTRQGLRFAYNHLDVLVPRS